MVRVRALSGVSVVLALLALPLFVAGCTTNVATGQSGLITLTSPEDEAAAGAEAHPKIVAAYGGVYNDPQLSQYVAGVTRRIVSGTHTPPQTYRVTVLNTPIVNAFALPGGYVYVTRGLLALVDDEAELAGVMGHEIGHVIAHHSAQRQSAELGVSMVGAVLGAVVGDGAVAQALGLGGQGLLAGYSRDQEFEADGLGVRYLAGAGYDPYAQSDFLEALERTSKLDALIAGNNDDAQPDWLASHPATPERVAAARREAQASNVPHGQGDRNQDALYRAIDGMIYGDSPEQGIVLGQTFIHPVERVKFTAPAGFRIVNGMDVVTVLGPAKTVAKFDAADKASTLSLEAYLANVWAANVTISPVELYTIHGLKAARASAKFGGYDATLVAIEASDRKVYRFLMGVPQEVSPRYIAELDRLADSFQIISPAEAASAKPLRLHIVTVGPQDTVISLAAHMHFDDLRTERFLALNGLARGAKLHVGEKVKIITQ